MDERFLIAIDREIEVVAEAAAALSRNEWSRWEKARDKSVKYLLRSKMNG